MVRELSPTLVRPNLGTPTSGLISGLIGIINVKDYGATGDGVTDDLAAINLAYAALGSDGGILYFPAGTYVISAGLSFSTVGKMVTLVGHPGSASRINYSPTTGTAITFNCGNDLDMGFGMRDIRLVGAGNANASKGILLGGTNGAQGFYASGLRVETFGTGIEYSDRVWITSIHHSMIRNCTTLLIVPGGLTETGEALDFDHVTFADSPSPHTDAVWIKGTTETTFRVCAFDQAQLSVGNSTTSGAQVTCLGCHFENPNLGTNYDFFVTSNHAGNQLRIVGGNAIQAKTSSGPAQLGTFSGGSVNVHGLGIYTTSTLTNFAVLANAVNCTIIDFDDKSGAISGNLLGGSTTGYIIQIPGANAGGSARNIVIGAGAVGAGVGPFDVAGTYGTYTPTLTNVTNLDSTTAVVAHYIRVGNQVFVSGRVVVDPTAAGATEVDISLPIASNLSSASDHLTGGGHADDSAIVEHGFIQGDTTNDRARFQFVAVSTASHGMVYQFSYTVI